MSVFKRAFLYLIRKKTRSILLFLILFSMGLFMLVGLSIRFSASQAALDMRKSISSGLEIKMNDVSGEEIYATSYNEEGELGRDDVCGTWNPQNHYILRFMGVICK